MSGMPAIEMPGNHNNGSGSGSKDGYRVEIRTSYYSPIVLDGFVIDNVWRSLPIAKGAMPFGVNIPIKPWHSDMLDHGLVAYEAAQAHRWAMLAALEAAGAAGSLCVETRLVKVRYKYSYKLEEVGVSEPEMGRSHARDVAPFNPRIPVVESDRAGSEGKPKKNPHARGNTDEFRAWAKGYDDGHEFRKEQDKGDPTS